MHGGLCRLQWCGGGEQEEAEAEAEEEVVVEERLLLRLGGLATWPRLYHRYT